MSKKNTELYYFVNTLNKTEKAYFKKFGYKYDKEDNAEMGLFNLINTEIKKTEDYDDLEKLLKIKFEKKYPSKKFITVKNNLFYRLIETLSEYDKTEDFQFQLLQNIQTAKVLIKRNQPKVALRILLKAVDVVEKEEEYSLGLVFTNLIYRCALMLGDKKNIKLSLDKNTNYLNYIKQQNDLKLLYEEVFDLHRMQGTSKHSEFVLALEKVEEKMKVFSKDFISQKQKFNFYSLQKIVAFLKNDKKEVLDALEKMVNILEQSNAESFSKNERVIIATYADLISHQLELGSNTYFKKYFNVIEKWTTVKTDIEIYKETQVLRLQILEYAFEHKFEKIADLEEKYLLHKKNMNDMFQLAINDCFILTYYCLRDFRNAVKFINFQFEIKNLRKDMQLMAELIQLALLFEDKDFDVLSNSVRSLESRLSTINVLITKEEEIILSFFKNAVSTKPISATEYATQCISQLKEIDYTALPYSFDFNIWFLAIKTKKTYLELLSQ
ncbi:MAG: hypothetical protein H6578_07370 [Chitinophagales bacterium]|nr:hypothetical protein [Chitinophagales bacterium]